MFEWLFKYPASVFSKGDVVLLAAWPAWVLIGLILAAGGALAWHVLRRRAYLDGWRRASIWLLQAGAVALILILLWQPALSVATLRPQQNIVAVMVDDSRSMGLVEGGATRLHQAQKALDSGVIEELRKKFQVRLYRFGKDAERVETTRRLAATQHASRIGESLKQVLADASGLPLGAVVLLSDGADNSGGIDRETTAQIRQRRIPVHTAGFGRERLEKDIELAEAAVPARALAGSRLNAEVTLRQVGYSHRKARIRIKDGERVLASREVTLKADGVPQTEPVPFQAGTGGAHTLQVAVDVLDGEENSANNAVTRLISVDSARPRILYIEGEPRWEFKFIRRAIEEDRGVDLVTILRTTQNKIYRQGIGAPNELEQGFPARPEDLFAYQGLIIGNVEVGYFTPAQRELIREFANRRGGGVLFLAGRAALSDGGYQHSPLAEMLPVRLADGKGTFHREEAMARLTPLGNLSLLCRLEENPEQNAARWKKMPLLADYQETGELKPGAVALLEVAPAGRRGGPLLAVENYGRGRTGLFASSGSWRWQMVQPIEDNTYETFWQQLLRWLVAGTPGQVAAATPKPVLADESEVLLRAEVRNKAFQAVANARVEARIVGPGGVSAGVELTPEPQEEGVYTARWTADRPGSFLAEIVARTGEEEIGRDVVMFRREDGVAENFRTAQNRELLEKLAEQTGGRYYRQAELAKLPQEISYSEAGITTRETRDLWDMPAVFLALLMLRGGEWVLRRKWGVV
jgi:uncharacterized membrane protein